MGIPPAYQIKEKKHQRQYLVNGTLHSWQGETTEVKSTISSTDEYAPTVLGSIPNMGKKEASEALDAALAAYDKGKGIWPTMKVKDRVSCMQRFVGKMVTKRDQLVIVVSNLFNRERKLSIQALVRSRGVKPNDVKGFKSLSINVLYNLIMFG